MTKRVAIVQSNYIPWKGYFDLIATVDEFILLDDVQFTRRDWRNRNQIKSTGGLLWLTIPVLSKGNYLSPIHDIRIANQTWADLHWKTIQHHYRRAAAYAEMQVFFEKLYARAAMLDSLSEVNFLFLRAICDHLMIPTPIRWSSEYQVVAGKTERLVALCQQAGAEVYVSGPSARAYLDEGSFSAAAMRVEYFDYSGYPEYRQLHPPFVHNVSIVDLMLNEGAAAGQFLKSLTSTHAIASR